MLNSLRISKPYDPYLSGAAWGQHPDILMTRSPRKKALLTTVITKPKNKIAALPMAMASDRS